MVVFVGSFEIGSFTPTSEIEGMQIVTAEDILKHYFGNKELLGGLLAIAHGH